MGEMSKTWFDLEAGQFLAKWYAQEYERTSYKSAAGLGHQMFHKQLEAPFAATDHFSRVLEIGANRGEHLTFVRHSYDVYVELDLACPDRASEGLNRTTSVKSDNSHDKVVAFVQGDVQHLPHASRSFDRVIPTCVLHHVNDAEKALLEVRRVTRPGGIVSLFLPCDPGTLFRIARRLGPVRAAHKRGLRAVKILVDARDHRNHVFSLRVLIQHTFRNDLIEVSGFPLSHMPPDLSLWYLYRITIQA